MIQKLYVCTKALTPWLFSARWQQTSKQASQAGIMGGMGMGKPCNHSTRPSPLDWQLGPNSLMERHSAHTAIASRVCGAQVVAAIAMQQRLGLNRFNNNNNGDRTPA
jgi:hypothetical protein